MRTAHALPCALLLAACSGDPTPAPAVDASSDAADVTDAPPADVAPPDAPPADAPRPPLAIPWRPCDSFAFVPEERAECAVVPVPLDWERPDGERIELYVRHVRAEAPSGRAVWILMGGPGQAGADGEGLAAVLSQRDPGLDVYLHDHRGTGFSTRLECPEAESPGSPGGPGILPAEWPGCRAQVVAEWGERLRHFSTTAAARDLAGLIDATRAPADRVFVFGVSYGTYLAHRYLQVAPRQSAGVVLDSLCPPGECHLSQQDQWEDGETRAVLARCAAEPACARRLGADPVGRLRELHRRVAGGTARWPRRPRAPRGSCARPSAA